MPYSMHLDNNIYRVKLLGVVTNADLLAVAQTTAELEAQHDVIPHRLADLSQVDDWQIDADGVAALVRERERHRFPNDIKTALVAPDMVHYGYARMFQTLMGHSQVRVAIFPTVAEGLQWLSTPGLELPKEPWAPPPRK